MLDKVAVIGFGNISKRHRINLKIRFPNSILFAMSASGRIPEEDVEGVDFLVADISELIAARPELVIIASPAPLHGIHATELIAADIPVLIEKPITSSLTEVDKLVELSSEFNTPVAVAHCLRYLPSLKVVKRLLEQKFIGIIYNVSINIGQYLPDWRPTKDYKNSVSANKALGGGVLLELSHELDYAQWLLGDLKLEHALLRNSKELNLDVEELADIVLSTKAGTVCNIHLDFLQKQVQRCCSFIGSKGRIDWDLITNTVIHYHSKTSDVIYSDPDWERNKMYLLMIDDFVCNIRNKQHECVSAEQARKTMLLIENIKANAQWGVTQ